MNALRDSLIRRLSAVFAGLALSLQLAFTGPGMLANAASPDAAGLLAEHALCLAGASDTQAPPADNAPTLPGHDHSLFCCLWHPLPGVAPQAAAVPFPISYASLAPSEPRIPAIVSGLCHRPANARAPPILA